MSFRGFTKDSLGRHIKGIHIVRDTFSVEDGILMRLNLKVTTSFTKAAHKHNDKWIAPLQYTHYHLYQSLWTNLPKSQTNTCFSWVYLCNKDIL